MKIAKLLTGLMFFGSVSVLHADGSHAPTPLAPSEMTTRAATIQTGIEDDNRKILVLRDRARKLKDVIKLNCVNDKVLLAKAQMNVADNANADLQGALQKNSDASVPFQQLTDAGTAIKSLHEEANGCIGQGELTKQESGTTVTRPIILDDPDTLEPFGPDQGGGGNVTEPPFTISGDGSL